MSTTALVLPCEPSQPFLARPSRAAAHRPPRARHDRRRPRPVRHPHAGTTGLRLTRRGRLLVTCTAATALTGAVVAVTGALTGASAGVHRAPAAVVVTVQPGQTLSAIASGWAPREDWREVAGRIVQLNEMPSMTVSAGQRLVMPTRD
ncbi:LysM peptidoglycan-binding domain-containing protein [Kineococcus sp. SYSU DK002]|uniref:LysM peptidoglycan-binding domain-containing protein n=1 Tax=Kineococcus sp. SYSU DK002 TaxID=3383123 RepID=UPI003D7D31C9